MTAIVRTLRLLLIGLWLGAAIFFAAAVAPALFNVLRGAGLQNANELAGSVVARLLRFINQGGFEIGLFLFVTAFFVNRHRSVLARVTEVISTAILAIMTAVSHWVISARMVALRAAMGSPIDQVSPTDPLRMGCRGRLGAQQRQSQGHSGNKGAGGATGWASYGSRRAIAGQRFGAASASTTTRITGTSPTSTSTRRCSPCGASR